MIASGAGSLMTASHHCVFLLFTRVCVCVCLLVLDLQARRAVQRGATAVIFDVSENPEAIEQVGAAAAAPVTTAVAITATAAAATAIAEQQQQ